MQMRLALQGKFDSFTWNQLELLKQMLKKFIPDERFFPTTTIVLDSESEDDDEDKKYEEIEKTLQAFEGITSPSGYEASVSSACSSSSQLESEVVRAIKGLMSPVGPIKKNVPKTPKKTPKKNQNSIATYAIKTSRLPPASIFAKPSEDKEKAPVQIISPHDVNVRVMMPLTPEQEEEKLKKVRGRIENNYVTFLENTNKRKIEVEPCKTFKKRRFSVHEKAILKENSQKEKIKRRQSCFVPTEETLTPRFATKKTRRGSLFNPPTKAKGKEEVEIPRTQPEKFLPNRIIIARARKEINDTELEKQLPKPAYEDFEMDEESKEFLDLMPLKE